MLTDSTVGVFAIASARAPSASAFCASLKRTSTATVLAPARAISSKAIASTSRDHGQRPMVSSARSSIATSLTRSPIGSADARARRKR
jgi:hypothetical protein